MMYICECWQVKGEALYSVALGPPGNHSTVAADNAGPGSTTTRKQTLIKLTVACRVYTTQISKLYIQIYSTNTNVTLPFQTPQSSHFFSASPHTRDI